ncbi:Fe(3+) ABC transporter substrate-binding protein [Temperatibacter marinus]|uniref:Fe(3+) ABC transporter substrate-binding protein n=2 Tax=Temperatibacter marinus TaxID=1456591 RepID=A0AA52EBL2_9PROT|nr:Fe(3+) ABC transporter substrate-binding protein [Temperatibacter marinus]WND01816.1 Fe(3+) ABC transporter substrate-binding protein [Temperatibacter marinus]
MKTMIKGILASSLALSGFGYTAVADEEVNIYSARKEQLIKPLLETFQKKTGIKVNLVSGSADALLKRLQQEGRNSPADILITTDAGRLHRAKEAGVTQTLVSKKVEMAIPAQYRDIDMQWVGLSLRARPIMYVKGKVNPSELSTYEDLANPKWKGKICIRSSSNIYNQSLVASILATNGMDKTVEWAEGMVSNFAKPPRGGDRDQIKAAAAGQCDIAVANTYYLAGMLRSSDATQVAAAQKVAVFWPNQMNRGTHVNVSGIAVTKASKNKDNAVKLIEFLSSKEAQIFYGDVNGEFSVRKDVEPSDLLKSWGSFKADSINLSKLGEGNRNAVIALDKAGWK